MKFRLPVETIWITVGAVFTINLYGFMEDLNYLLKGREKYFEDYMKNFVHPSKTMLTHGIIVVLCLFAYFLSLYSRWGKE